MTRNYRKMKRALEKHDRVVLFLDYDGTLADFTNHPDIVEPKAEVVALLEALIACDTITPSIISGRRLSHLQKLVPFPDMILAGTYGLEIQFKDEEIYYPLKFEKIRPALEELKPIWLGFIEGEEGFILEDKGWTLAIHARFVDEHTADKILLDAQKAASRELDPKIFQVKSGHKFLEVSPKQADKGQCVKFLVNKISTENAVLLYLGDDDKDEVAFEVVHSLGGFAIRVCSNMINNPIEDWRLDNPKAARDWLWMLARNCS